MTGPTHEPTRRIGRRRALGLIGTGLVSAFAGCNARGGSQSGDANYQEGTTGDDEPSGNGSSPNASEATAAEARAETQPSDYAIELDALELRDHELVVQDNYKGVTIQGFVEHTGNERLELAEVRTRIYDADGNRIGLYLDSTNALDPGSTWNFEIIVLESPGDVDSYDIAAVGSLG